MEKQKNLKNHDLLFKELKSYMEIEGMSRYEDDVIAHFKNRVSIKLKNDNVQRDGLGSIIVGDKNNNVLGPKILLAAHCDEVGYMVKSVDDNGQIMVASVGGIWPTAVIGTKAHLIVGQTNKRYQGVFGHTSVHIIEKEKLPVAIKTKELFVDFGFKDKKEAEATGISVGDRIYMSGDVFRMENNLVSGKSMDNRAGLVAVDMVAQALKDTKLVNQVYYAATVQEEVGSRGAKLSTKIIAPDVAIAIDTCASHDTVNAPKGTPKLGKGVSLLIHDYGTMIDPKLMNLVMDLAKKHNIDAYKFISEGGGSDAEELQYGGNGVATLAFFIPQRYLHSPLGVASLDDIQSTIDLVVELVKALDQKTWSNISYK